MGLGNHIRFLKKEGLGRYLSYHLHLLRAAVQDQLIGGRRLNRRIPTKYADLGANDTQSTYYHWLDRVFRLIKLSPEDVVIDIGCGEGRVLTYLHQKNFAGKLYGIELDPDIAAIAAARTKHLPNIEILCANVMDCPEILRQGTIFYLFNPFDMDMFDRFESLLEMVMDHPFLFISTGNELVSSTLKMRPGWEMRDEQVIDEGDMQGRIRIADYCIYEYTP